MSKKTSRLFICFRLDFDHSKQVTYYCRKCFTQLQKLDQENCYECCSLNDKKRLYTNVVELVISNVKEEISIVAQHHLQLITHYPHDSNRLLPADVPNGMVYQRLRRDDHQQLTILLHTDGATVTKVGGKSLWPIQGTIAEIPPPIRDRNDAVMVFGAWLGACHPNRNLLWSSVVEQIEDLCKNGIILKSDNGKRIKFDVRVQLITFDLPALAQNCNIIQFNGYDGCPYCKVHGSAIGTQIFYPHAATPAAKKTNDDYMRLSRPNLPRTNSLGIKGPTPLTKILVFPLQICADYMHLVCSGHFKTLVNYWSNLLLPNVFEQASNYLSSITLPHSFGYQFMPLTEFNNWKTKYFR